MIKLFILGVRSIIRSERIVTNEVSVAVLDILGSTAKVTVDKCILGAVPYQLDRRVLDDGDHLPV